MVGEFKARRHRRLYSDDECPCCGQILEVPGRIMMWEDELLVIRANVLVYLGRQHFQMLRTLLDVWPRKVSYDFLVDEIWGDESKADGNAINVVACKLRRQIAPLGLSIPLATNGDYGYMLQIEKWESDPPVKRIQSPLRVVS